MTEVGWDNLDNKLLFPSNSFVPLFGPFDVFYLHNIICMRV